jgi:DNA-directed DNA polymerase III PolC
MLNTHTYYSLKYGTISQKEQLQLMRQLGYDRYAITDINNTSALLDALRQAPKHGIKPVFGIDFRNGVKQQFVALAKNNAGFQEMNEFLTQHLHSEEAIPFQAPEFEHCFVIYPFRHYRGQKLREFEFVGLHPRDLPRFRLSNYAPTAKASGAETWIPEEKLVSMLTMSFRNKRDFNAHRLLRAIDNNTLLSKLDPEEQGFESDRFCSKADLKAAFAEAPQMFERAEKILAECEVDFDFSDEKEHLNQRTYTGSEAEDYQLIRRLCREGLRYRYYNPDKQIRARLEKELQIIKEKGFISYFLINWDITSYARSKGYFHVGRGSGANSIVAYLLRITDVDPIDLDLYFERFINLYRQNPPDFDVDFSWKDREDVTRYIFERFPHCALLCTYNTFQYRAVVRELGKVFGLPKEEIDILSRGKFNPRKLDKFSQLALKYCSLIQGFPSHLSVHAGGIVISEKPLQAHTPTFMPPKGFPTTQFDMVVAEDIGLYKFDILGQRGLGKIKDTLEVVRRNRPEDPIIDIHDMARFRQDEKVKDLLRNGKAMGCFYVESPAMRMLLKKLKVDTYLGLVAASSIIRPGVAKSGMMREYILRFRYPERRKDAHPVMLDIMPETYGVMVYQEDVIKVAHYLAGLTLGEADALRRGMSGKYRSREEFQRAKDKFFSNCLEKGYTKELTAEIWRQTESFAGYAFSKGHSASYAVESYQSLFLKAHYPLEFMVGVINNFGGFYRTEFYVHEARMWGATIHAPDVNKSDYLTTIYGKDLYLGFIHVRDLESHFAGLFEWERQQHGPFESLEDFMERVPAPIGQLSILIRMDAFRFTGKNKRELLWEAYFRLSKDKSVDRPQQLFKVKSRPFVIPQLTSDELENAFDQLELLGFPLVSPFKLLKDRPANPFLAADFPTFNEKIVKILGYLVTIKDTGTVTGKRMHFGTFVDQDGHFFDTTHFPKVAASFPFYGRGIYEITGKVVEEFGFHSMEVTGMRKLDMIEDPRYSEMDTSTRQRHASDLGNTEEDQGKMKNRRDQLEKLT